MQTKKVLIIGAGPAGLSCAIEMGKIGGFDVILLEKKEKIDYKICAGGVEHSFLKKYLSEEIIERRFNNVKFSTPKQIISIKNDDYNLITLNRKDLHEFLAKKAIERGTKIIFNESFRSMEGSSVITESGKKFFFDYLIGADGSNSKVRKSLGIGTKKIILAFQYIIPGNYPNLEFHTDIEKFGYSYAWIFPQGKVVSVGAGFFPNDSKKFTMNILLENFKLWAGKKFDLNSGKFEAFPINYDFQGFEFGNIYLAGDAAGLASGLTGEGIKFAMLSGSDIARKIADRQYECSNIDRALKIKKASENFRELLKINKISGKITLELFAFLLKTRFGGNIISKVS